MCQIPIDSHLSHLLLGWQYPLVIVKILALIHHVEYASMDAEAKA